MAFDWKKEKENATEGKYLKLETGNHKVTFLNEGGEPYEAKFTDKATGKEVVQQKVDFNVEYAGKQHVWGVTRTQGSRGLWQQIVSVGAKSGSLVGKTVTVIMKGSGKDKDYTIFDGVQ